MADKELPTGPIIRNPSPKMIFRSTAVKVTNHLRMIESPVMRESIDVAMLEYQRKLAYGAGQANDAAGSMFKIKGALEFIDEFFKLADAPPPPKTAQPSERIDHTV